MTEMWLIWSEEHGAWWGPGEQGYVRSIFLAGRYSRDHAARIAKKANRHLPAGSIYEVAMPDPVRAEE